MLSAVLTLHCTDTRGIVYNVSRFIYERGGNIIDAQQHREELDNRFFMRVHFDCSEAVARERWRAELEVLTAAFSMQATLSFSDEIKRCAILVSKYDHCLYDLFLRNRYGEIQADIALVLSNHDDLRSVAQNFGVPFHHFPVTPENKTTIEHEMLALLQREQIDFLVLARYMQIITSVLVEPYRNRIINVHHGFLPAFKGARPYHQAYEHGVKLIGATSHYVTEDLDMGPIIEQETIPVKHSHAVADLVTMGRDVEKKVLAAAVKAHAADRLMVFRSRTIVFD